MGLIKITIDEREKEEVAKLQRLLKKTYMSDAAREAILSYRFLMEELTAAKREIARLKNEKQRQKDAIQQFVSAFDALKKEC